MTTKTAKTATVAAVALTLVAVMLAYSTMLSPASAQAATSTASTTSAISASNTNSNTSAPPGQWAGPGGQQALFQGGQGRGGQGPIGQGPGPSQQQVNLTVGQTITVTSSQGKFYAVGNTADNGTASGTVTFAVTGKLAAGYTLSITQGSIVVNGTTYAISSGSAQMSRAATTLTGQGATTPSGAFIIQASARGSFAGTSATMSLDLGAGTAEYLVTLAGTVQG
jgi:hypothetical protein